MIKYEMLLFDLDDTLVNNTENARYAFKQMLINVNKEYNDEEFQRWLNLDNQFWKDYANKKIIVPEQYQHPQELFIKYIRSLRYQMFFNYQIDINKAFEINEIFISSLNEIAVPIDGVYETLEYLHNKYKIVIATNGPTVAVDSKLSKIDCLKFINAVFSADMAKDTVTKPNKLYFEELKKYLQYYDTSKMLIIGDSLRTEVQGGMNSGIDSCWYNPYMKPVPNEYNPTMEINNLRELIRKL